MVDLLSLLYREYRISSTKMTRDEGYDYCDSLGMGLALWNSETSHLDIK